MPLLYIGIAILLFISALLVFYILIKNKAKKAMLHENNNKDKEKIEKKEEPEFNYAEYKICRKEKFFIDPKDEE